MCVEVSVCVCVCVLCMCEYVCAGVWYYMYVEVWEEVCMVYVRGGVRVVGMYVKVYVSIMWSQWRYG